MRYLDDTLGVNLGMIIHQYSIPNKKTTINVEYHSKFTTKERSPMSGMVYSKLSGFPTANYRISGPDGTVGPDREYLIFGLHEKHWGMPKFKKVHNLANFIVGFPHICNGKTFVVVHPDSKFGIVESINIDGSARWRYKYRWKG